MSQSASLVRLSEAHPFVVGFWRLLASALIMAGLHFYISKKKGQVFWRSSSRSHGLATLVSGVFFFLHLWTFFVAAQTTSIANCMVIFSTNPIFTALGAWIWFKEKFERRHGMALSLAFLGIGLLFYDRLSWEIIGQGDFAALMSALFFSGYMLTGKKSRSFFSTENYTWIIYFITAILFGLAGLFIDVNWVDYPLKTWLAIAATVIFPTLLGHVLITYLLQYFNINVLSCGKLAEPALSAIVAFYLFGESLSSKTIFSFILTVFAVLVLMGPFLKKTFSRPIH